MPRPSRTTKASKTTKVPKKSPPVTMRDEALVRDQLARINQKYHQVACDAMMAIARELSVKTLSYIFGRKPKPGGYASLEDAVRDIVRPQPDRVFMSDGTMKVLHPGTYEIEGDELVPRVVRTVEKIVTKPVEVVVEKVTKVPEPVRWLPPNGRCLLPDGSVARIGSRWRVVNGELLPVMELQS